MTLVRVPGSFAVFSSASLSQGEAALAWLGQSGFAVRTPESLVLIDPYLSDSLADKYKGTVFPHIRMMMPPVAPETLHGVDAVLCTHRHSDHMDPGTLSVVATNNPQCHIVAPAAEHEATLRAGFPEKRARFVNEGDSFSLMPGIAVTVLSSAHEDMRTNAAGEHHYLGYVLGVGGVRVYHSGDCVSYPGQPERLRELDVDIALLPVNGRDAHRMAHGVPGNMSFAEAVVLCREAKVDHLIVHHFGMFDFNTVDADKLRAAVRETSPPPHGHVPDVETYWTLSTNA